MECFLEVLRTGDNVRRDVDSLWFSTIFCWCKWYSNNCIPGLRLPDVIYACTGVAAEATAFFESIHWMKRSECRYLSSDSLEFLDVVSGSCAALIHVNWTVTGSKFHSGFFFF